MIHCDWTDVVCTLNVFYILMYGVDPDDPSCLCVCCLRNGYIFKYLCVPLIRDDPSGLDRCCCAMDVFCRAEDDADPGYFALVEWVLFAQC